MNDIVRRNLRLLRKAAGFDLLTVSQILEQRGIKYSESGVSRLERIGTHFSGLLLAELAAIYSCKVSDFFSEKEPEPTKDQAIGSALEDAINNQSEGKP